MDVKNLNIKYKIANKTQLTMIKIPSSIWQWHLGI